MSLDLYSGDAERLEALLDDGWEPFSAYSTSVYNYVALRRQRPESGAREIGAGT